MLLLVACKAPPPGPADFGVADLAAPVAGHCRDGVVDGDESDVDCGGRACAGCGVSLKCSTGADCLSGVCAAAGIARGSCVSSACEDGVRDGLESDVDCGGGCPPCQPGRACRVDGDCAGADLLDGGGGNGVCVAGVCRQHCSDGIQEADETDVDCGGYCDNRGCLMAGGGPRCSNHLCDFGQKCLTNWDCGWAVGRGGGLTCWTWSCVNGRCASPCTDGVANFSETDVDCGDRGPIECGIGHPNFDSPQCQPCAAGKACSTDSDCASNMCRSRVCN